MEMQIPATPSQSGQSRAGRYDGNMALVASLSAKTNYQQRLIEESMRCQLLKKWPMGISDTDNGRNKHIRQSEDISTDCSLT